MLSLALGAGTIAKGATGLGLPLIAFPLLTASVGLAQAIGIILIPALVTNAYQVWVYRRSLRDPALGFLPGFLVGGIGGIALGTWALGSFSDRTLEAGLGVILLCYVGVKLLRPTLVVQAATAMRAGPAIGCAAGVLQGATGIAAPIGVTFMHALGLAREATVLAVSIMFLGFAVVHFVSINLAGIYRIEWVWLGLFACLPILVFLPVGEWLGRRASPRLFDRLVLLFLALIGTRLAFGL